MVAKKRDAQARTCQWHVEIRRLYLETTLFNSPPSLKLPIKRLTQCTCGASVINNHLLFAMIVSIGCADADRSARVRNSYSKKDSKFKYRRRLKKVLKQKVKYQDDSMVCVIRYLYSQEIVHRVASRGSVYDEPADGQLASSEHSLNFDAQCQTFSTVLKFLLFKYKIFQWI